jgi:hypothetical protein
MEINFDEMSLLKFLGKVITDALYVISTEDDPYRL